jgi:hypothetical protein
MKKLSRPRLGAIVTAILAAVGLSVIGSGTAQATADLHYDCLTVTTLVVAGNNTILSGFNCTGALGTEWGTVTDLRAGVTYWCNPLSGSVVGSMEMAHGSFCHVQ